MEEFKHNFFFFFICYFLNKNNDKSVLVRKCIEARIEEIRENLGSKRLTGMIWKKAFETDSCEYAYQLITNPTQVYYENFDREFDDNVSHLKEQPVFGGKTISKHVQKLSFHFFFFLQQTFLIFEKKLNINLKQNKQDLLKDCCLQVAIGTTQFICRVDIFKNRVSNELNAYLNKPYVPKLDEVLKKILNDIKNTMRSTCLGCMEVLIIFFFTKGCHKRESKVLYPDICSSQTNVNSVWKKERLPWGTFLAKDHPRWSPIEYSGEHWNLHLAECMRDTFFNKGLQEKLLETTLKGYVKVSVTNLNPI
ncbi:hypothetical protein RFI_29104 [Reticulomyxa filosa]|uniref:Uncharacterized protein n=1 Tax=Reticulomyxa filosa TaxID=46433 RepID=X6M2W9_RETFI|nr:hypothetical protein RFI_29104 [Reticulomyxa filosa]|eukprot:ETO08284.1 hypothetical protein RFI_29104 [Reticulomyxa filosa]